MGERERRNDDQPRDPHHELNNPIDDPDPTEWPDPYEKRPDPRGPDGEVFPGAISTSQPHPDQDPEADHPDAPDPYYERLDD